MGQWEVAKLEVCWLMRKASADNYFMSRKHFMPLRDFAEVSESKSPFLGPFILEPAEHHMVTWEEKDGCGGKNPRVRNKKNNLSFNLSLVIYWLYVLENVPAPDRTPVFFSVKYVNNIHYTIYFKQ